VYVPSLIARINEAKIHVMSPFTEFDSSNGQKNLPCIDIEADGLEV
jgi:hypothetical protein